MRFDRTALITLIDEIEADRQAAHDDAFAPRQKAWDAAVADYAKRRAPKLAKQLQALADRAAAGDQLDDSALSKALGLSGNYGGRTFNGFVYPKDPTAENRYSTLTEPPEPTPYKPDRQLKALRQLLTKATSDEHVTTSVLRELGFSPSLFIKAAV